MLVTCSISGRILVRAVHRAISVSTLNGADFKALGIHFTISVVLLAMAGLMALLIPSFDNFTTLVGSLTLPFLGFGIPAVFYLRTLQFSRRPVPREDVVFISVLFCFLALLVVLGTISTVENIIGTWKGSSNLCDY
jgi:hypothetical protein